MSGEPLLLNLGAGPHGGARIPSFFDGWQQVRIDIDAGVDPDIVANMIDLAAVESDSVDAIWSAHCVEHLYQHEVGQALAEMRRVLKSSGFACILVPDLQTIAHYVAADRIDDVIYTSPIGPITAHDVLFGYGPAIAGGKLQMAHRSGFTPTAMVNHLKRANFAQFVLRRRASLELAVVARKTPWSDPTEHETLLRQLGL